MGYSLTPIGAPLGTYIAEDPALGATPDDNLRSGATNLYNVEVDNSLNSVPTYIQLYNNASPSVGTTEADIRLLIPAALHINIPFPFPVPFGTAISMAATTTPGGSTSPTFACKVLLTIS